MPSFTPPIVDSIEMPPPNPSSDNAHWIHRDVKVLAPCNYRTPPIAITHGHGSTLWDADGRAYLDMHASLAVMAVGHTHPAVVEAIATQAQRLTHCSSTDFTHPTQVELAERLTALVPWMPQPQVCFTLGGADSVEAGLKLARLATGRSAMVCFSGGFHGRSAAALSVTSSKLHYKHGAGVALSQVYTAPYPYPPPEEAHTATEACLEALAHEALYYLETQVFQHHVAPSDIAAFIIEPIQGEGGYRQAHPCFYQGLQALAWRYGILFMVDEVQTGLGRTGQWWSSHGGLGLEPDIVLCAKGLASGLPLGAVLASKALFKHFYPMAHASTFTANPMACAAALATLTIIEKNNLLANARTQGERLYQGLQSLPNVHPETVQAVRGGWGLMAAVEYHTPHARDSVLHRLAYEEGILTVGCGRKSLRLCPPLNIQSQEMDRTLEALHRVSIHTF